MPFNAVQKGVAPASTVGTNSRRLGALRRAHATGSTWNQHWRQECEEAGSITGQEAYRGEKVWLYTLFTFTSALL